jgi:predicted ATPase/DNA-binding winged helix-turn-helix (wHTH) protein
LAEIQDGSGLSEGQNVVEHEAPNIRGGRIAFGPFCLSPRERLLTYNGAPVDIGGRSLSLLMALVEQPGQVIAKRELLRRVWPDVLVEDGSLRFHMAGLRKVLRDGIDGARYIDTQVGVGYAFVAPVRHLDEAKSETVLQDLSPHRESAPSIVGRLPERIPRLFGRESDVRLITDRILGNNLFTIVGPGGVGKTTLAVEIGHRLLAEFADKVHFVDLGAVEQPELAPSAIANALGIPVQGENTIAVVLGHIRDKRLLLLLDNCEHLADAISVIVESIGDAAPGVTILATSREPLRAREEHVHWLGSLAYPAETAGLAMEDVLAYPAIQLFIARAVAANSALAIDLEAARKVAEICRKLDGMALPIELTSVRVATHGLDATAQLIGERFSLGWMGRRTALPRQQTLQATLDWSYHLLSDIERRTLERLSAFLGPFSQDAALDVVADDSIDPTAVAAALDGLIAKSLIARNRGAGVNAYRLLEMTRAYAREKLLAHDREAAHAAALRHARYFLNLLEDVLASDGSLSNGIERIAGQIGNIRSALGVAFGPDGDTALAVRLAAASASVFLNLSLLVECRTWSARALAALDGHSEGTAAELELQAALGLSLMFTRGNSDAVETALRRALEIAVALQDRWNQLRLLGRLHIFFERMGNYAVARDWAHRALQVADEIGEAEAMAVASSLAGISHHLAGDHLQAKPYLERSVQLSPPSERWRTIHYGFDHRNRSLIALSRSLWIMGYAERARQVAEEAVREAARLDHPTTHCIALIWALPTHVGRGDMVRAKETLDSLASLAEANAFGPYIAAIGGLRGAQALILGHWGDAVGMIEESLARLRAARYDLLTTSLSTYLSLALSLAGRDEEALEVINATIDRTATNGDHIFTPSSLRVKANILLKIAPQNPEAAESLYQEALGLSRRQGARALELRIAMDIAQLRARQGRTDDARTLLYEVRSAFTEGFQTLDLRDADMLLETLSSGSNWNDATVPSSFKTR